MTLDPLLPPVLIPLLAALCCLLLPAGWQRERGWLAVGATAATLLAVWPVFLGDNRELAWGGWLLLRVDPLSRLVLLAAAVFALLIAIYSLGYFQGAERISPRRAGGDQTDWLSDGRSAGWAAGDLGGPRIYEACLLGSLAFTCGVLLAGELLLLVICWGLLAVTLYLMIGLTGPDASEAARKTFLIVGGADTLLLLGSGLLWFQHGSTRLDAAAVHLDSATGYLAFFCFLSAAFAKAGAVPFHSWLPDCGEKAHAPVTAYLPAALDKLLGVYLLVRIARDWFVMTDAMYTLLMFFGAVTILGGAMMAIVQSDLKRLLSYCAVSQVGYILLGIGTGTPLGLVAGLFHMLNHAIYKSCLFLVAGVVQQKAGEVDLDRLGGLATRLPMTFCTCLVASLAVSGIPPFNGFASKWMVYQAIIESGQQEGGSLWVFWLATAMFGSALTLAIIVKMLHSVFLCKPSPQIRQRSIQRAGWSEVVPLALLSGLCLLFGVFAMAVPLRWFILPAVSEPVIFHGTWWAGQAS
ncbi:MAG: hypothetical protein GTO53_03510, partial [Planctomycetales bacterium]|nr:hypothetical protein [Planctomycetales bacterium]NIM08232.1 hypothetical protein [Planctomycetales bacterium]NIN07726.1 hypothetical protein [Planctomycetales bacterium]NIN76852.1 hypothetical protein [Planctomycetales bacterium]NIO34048.1 hypothetical protein [Planctomycetales bacterium]